MSVSCRADLVVDMLQHNNSVSPIDTYDCSNSGVNNLKQSGFTDGQKGLLRPLSQFANPTELFIEDILSEPKGTVEQENEASENDRDFTS